MNAYKYLVWEYSTANGKWFDATTLVEWIRRDNNAFFVKFYDKPKAIFVSYKKLVFYDSPQEIEFMFIEHCGAQQYKVKKCLKFGEKYKLFYENGHTLVANSIDIKIYKDALKDNPGARGILNYYKKVVQLTAKTEEEDYLLSQFDEISQVNADSVLSLYLKKKNGMSTCPLDKPIISPFGTNLSQMKAVKNAFSNRISIIEGPPGTGKTQTILNLIANMVTTGYSVAVVSNNNSAIENVKEKLEKYGFGFLCALLGNKENKETFFETLDVSIPDLTTDKQTQMGVIKRFSDMLPKLFELENRKNKLIENKNAIELEYKHFLNEHIDFDFDKYKFKTQSIAGNKLLEILVLLKELKEGKFSFFQRIKTKFALKVSSDFDKLTLEEKITLLENQYFLIKIRDNEKECKTIDKTLKDMSFQKALELYKNLSLTSFKNSLSALMEHKRSVSYSKSNYKIYFEKFVEDFPVILSSTYALAQSAKNGYLFDYLIVDESSQVNMASAILSMRVAKNIVIVGDINQLPQIDDKGFEQTNTTLLKQFRVDESFSYYGNSILSSVLKVYGYRVPRTMLKEHYRCSPEIIGFCNQEFYNNELVVYTKKKNDDKTLHLVKLVEGNHARKNPNGDGGMYSNREADEILEIINRDKPEDLGIIAPYRIQTKVIMDKIGDYNAEVSTIHKFQGREKKNIILSTVVNSSNEFVDDPNMVNVAVSRAIDSFTLVASDKIVNGGSGVLYDLVNYIKYHTEFGDAQEGTVSSVFDILYDDYNNQLAEYRKKHPSKDFDTENIIKNLIQEILSNSKYKNYKFSMHVSLKDIFRHKFIPMTSREASFFFNPLTHADFVIYNKIGNKPYAIIEVDGVSFHEQSAKQSERDALKNSIIEKSGIKFMRLKTNESNERNRIIELLES